MFPPGHLAAGYLVTEFALTKLSALYPGTAQLKFLAVGILASVAVDLDDLYAFIRIGRPIAATRDFDHRKFITHAPALHLAIAALGFTLAQFTGSIDRQLYAIVYLLGTWTHLFFDSFGNGIMWLWPISRRLYSFFASNKRLNVPESLPTVVYWQKFLIEYSRSLVFYLEILVIIAALLNFYLT